MDDGDVSLLLAALGFQFAFVVVADPVTTTHLQPHRHHILSLQTNISSETAIRRIHQESLWYASNIDNAGPKPRVLPETGGQKHDTVICCALFCDKSESPKIQFH